MGFFRFRLRLRSKPEKIAALFLDKAHVYAFDATKSCKPYVASRAFGQLAFERVPACVQTGQDGLRVRPRHPSGP